VALAAVSANASGRLAVAFGIASAGIEVYAIGLDKPDVSQSLLGLCASDAQHYFNPSSNTGASGSDQLAIAFKTIAQRLIVGNPRLVM